VTSAGGHGGMLKAALLMLWAVYAAAVIFKAEVATDTISSLIVWTEVAFVFSSCWTICNVAKAGSVLLSPNVVRMESRE
jgi:hypothetical protein